MYFIQYLLPTINIIIIIQINISKYLLLFIPHYLLTLLILTEEYFANNSTTATKTENYL